MNVTRTRMPAVVSITTAKYTITLLEGQCFYQTKKAWEIWNEKPLQRIKRIPRQQVFWVEEK